MSYTERFQELRNLLTAVQVPVDSVPVDTGALPQTFSPAAVGLRCGTGGTVTLTTAAGNSRVLNFTDGETRLIAFTAVTSVNTADDLEALVAETA